MSIQEGNYRARAIAGSEQFGQNEKTGTDQIVINFELLDIGEQVSVFLYFTDKAAPHSMKRLRAAGWTGADPSDLVGLGSCECEVKVFYEDYQGELKMKTEIVSGGTVVLANKLDDKGKKAFGAKFKALAAQSIPAANGAVNTDAKF